MPLSPFVALLLAALDGQRTLHELLDAFANQAGSSRERIESPALTALATLYAEGAVEFAPERLAASDNCAGRTVARGDGSMAGYIGWAELLGADGVSLDHVRAELMSDPQDGASDMERRPLADRQA